MVPKFLVINHHPDHPPPPPPTQVWFRLSKHSAINSEVEILKDSFNIDWDPIRETITAAFPNGHTCKFMLKVCLLRVGACNHFCNFWFACRGNLYFVEGKCTERNVSRVRELVCVLGFRHKLAVLCLFEECVRVPRL